METQMLRFIAAPPKPPSVAIETWTQEWIGLEVSFGPALGTVGYLGHYEVCLCDGVSHAFRALPQAEVMEYLSRHPVVQGMVSIKRGALSYVCSQRQPTRPTILAWLNMNSQVLRNEFAVPLSMVEII
jgi:hypothetical protein